MHSPSKKPRSKGGLTHFAPVPFRALEPETLSPSALRLLAYLLMVWVYQGRPERIEVSDHELLRGQKDRSGRKLPSCGLHRNTMKKARMDLEDLGFIRSEFVREENQEHCYTYELVSGMALNFADGECQAQTIAPSEHDGQYVASECQAETMAVSEDDALYDVQTIELSPDSGSRDGQERSSTELTPDRKKTFDVLLGEISRLYEQHHPEHLPMPNEPSVRTVLRNFISSNPRWPEEVLMRGVRNYFRSENTNKAKSPERWIRQIPDFSVGPQDQFGHVMASSASNSPTRGTPHNTEQVFAACEQDELVPFC